jgi:serine/threonine protein kinase
MHDKGVVHRDMNPMNIFIDVSNENKIKILDFNVSKVANLKYAGDGEEEEKRSEQRYRYHLFTKTGTPMYAPPEMQTFFKYT